MKFQDLPLKRKLSSVILVTSFSALLLTCLALFTIEVNHNKRITERNLRTVANIVAANSTAAVMYDSPKDAQEILMGFRAENEVVSAALYDENGKLFATYPTNLPLSHFPANVQPDGSLFEKDTLILFTPVMENNVRAGTLYLQGDLKVSYHRLRVYGMVLLSVLFGSGLVAVLLSNMFQKRITQPLLHLADTARLVTERKDFSVRATKVTGDELGLLTDAFNSMLDQIQTSHSALRDSEARLSAVFQQAGAGIALMDLQGCFLMVNERYGDIVGRQRSSLSNTRLNEITPDEDLAKAQPSFEALHQDGRSCTLELRHVRPDGDHVWVRTTMVAIRDANNKVESVLAVSQDITEQRAAAENLQKARDEAVAASRAKDDFLAALSHELRTPLSPVLLLASEALNDESLPASARRDFQTIVQNVTLEARLIDDLLDLTTITRGKIALNRSVLDVHVLLKDALTKVQNELEQKRIGLSVEMCAPRHTVHGDPVRLQQVFWNILKNAVKFTPAGGKITVQTKEQDGDMMAVCIEDTGFGLTPGELENIFDAFAQGEHVVGGCSHRFGGLGLGLAISRSLVELHAGHIRATSAGRDRGATFLIELPLWKTQKTDHADKETPSSTSKPSLHEGLRILLVEDHEHTRFALTRLLTRRGHHVKAVESSKAALAAMDREEFDVLVSDIGLPDGNGYDLMSECRDRFGLRGIALTGYGMEDDVARSRNAGFVTHLTKPVVVQSLEQALRLAVQKTSDKA